MKNKNKSKYLYNYIFSKSQNNFKIIRKKNSF